ncbi:MAG: hypothetical protein NC247_06060, partial [Ruminococcus flavefaciens]|nr:hypothetical protein [Ruminococcus flavefaciens]
TVNLLLFSFDGPNPSSPTKNTPNFFGVVFVLDLANYCKDFFMPGKKEVLHGNLTVLCRNL